MQAIAIKKRCCFIGELKKNFRGIYREFAGDVEDALKIFLDH